ncbi:putative integral membrane protein [Theileria parva strain Muguga]|uniref:putative integral membrane protein n=1 Tax=Theileria parva strain Muguga TaxID=333668 RepID=UPI001C61CA3F|nr:putative integral membrane protein [Theileria parva strain Muguga]KAF5153388.1 putative integral membrane protein [Theileria parva strain Muguga]
MVLKSVYRNLPSLYRSNYILTQRVKYHAKSKYEGKGFRKLLGPLWPLTTPGFLQSYALITGFFLLLYYPLDSCFFGVRKLKAEMDAKVGG